MTAIFEINGEKNISLSTKEIIVEKITIEKAYQAINFENSTVE